MGNKDIYIYITYLGKQKAEKKTFKWILQKTNKRNCAQENGSAERN